MRPTVCPRLRPQTLGCSYDRPLRPRSQGGRCRRTCTQRSTETRLGPTYCRARGRRPGLHKTNLVSSTAGSAGRFVFCSHSRRRGVRSPTRPRAPEVPGVDGGPLHPLWSRRGPRDLVPHDNRTAVPGRVHPGSSVPGTEDVDGGGGVRWDRDTNTEPPFTKPANTSGVRLQCTRGRKTVTPVQTKPRATQDPLCRLRSRSVGPETGDNSSDLSKPPCPYRTSLRFKSLT